MDSTALTELAKVRVQNDTKTLRKTIKDFYRLADPQLTGEELQAAHETFMIGLDQLAEQLSRTQRLQRVTEIEVAGYVEEARVTEATSADTTRRLVDLSERLASAQQERARRIEYDAIAKTIGKLPDRDKGKETKQKLVEDIATLKEEEETYAGTWRQRKEAFSSIVDSLESMVESIRDEKAEQERRRALDEDDNEATEVALDPHAKPFEPAAATAKSTPQAGNTPAAVADGQEEGEAMEGIEQEEGEEGEEREEGEMNLDT